MGNSYSTSTSDDQAFYQAYCKYFGRDGMKIDPAGAFPIAKELAQKNMPGAMALLGVMFFEGKATKKDIVQSRYWLERGAVAGDSWAQRILGQHMLKEDAIFGENIWLSLYWLEKAAAQKDPVACWWVGESYSRDDRIPHDLKKALYWYEKGAELGDLDCQGRAATLYVQGEGIEKNPERAALWMRNLAENGAKTAQYYMGMFHKNGDGVEKDYREACRWFALAAQNGDPDGLTEIKKIQSETANDFKFIYSHDLEHALQSESISG